MHNSQDCSKAKGQGTVLIFSFSFFFLFVASDRLQKVFSAGIWISSQQWAHLSHQTCCHFAWKSHLVITVILFIPFMKLNWWWYPIANECSSKQKTESRKGRSLKAEGLMEFVRFRQYAALLNNALIAQKLHQHLQNEPKGSQTESWGLGFILPSSVAALNLL